MSNLRIKFDMGLRCFWPYPESVLGRSSLDRGRPGMIGLAGGEGTVWARTLTQPVYDAFRTRRQESGAMRATDDRVKSILNTDFYREASD